jgi:hypothetical protein
MDRGLKLIRKIVFLVNFSVTKFLLIVQREKKRSLLERKKSPLLNYFCEIVNKNSKKCATGLKNPVLMQFACSELFYSPQKLIF